MNVKQIIHETAQAMTETENVYKKWSNSDHWNETPEYLSTVCIARRLVENLGVAVTLEDGIEGVLKETKMTKGPDKEGLNRHGRFDIVVWKGDRPIGVIEVKRTHGLAKLKPDIQRICSVLDKAKKIRWGLLAYSTRIWQGERKNANQRVIDKTDKIFSNAENFIKKGCDIRSFKKKVRRKSSDVAVTNVDSGDQTYELAWRTEVLQISRSLN